MAQVTGVHSSFLNISGNTFSATLPSPSGSSVGSAGGGGAAEGASRRPPRTPPPQVDAPFFSFARPPEQRAQEEAAASTVGVEKINSELKGPAQLEPHPQVNTSLSLSHPPGSIAAATGVLSPPQIDVPFFAFARPPELAESTTVLAIVISTPATGPLILIHSRGMIGQARHRKEVAAKQGAARESAVATAQRWASQILPSERLKAFLATQITNSPEGVLLVVVAPCLHVVGREILSRLGAGIVASRASFDGFWRQAAPGWGACTWTAVRDSMLAPVCGAALMAIDRLVHRPRPPPEPPPGAQAMATAPPPSGGS